MTAIAGRTSVWLVASNLHVGGGVQVAASLVRELAQLVADGELALDIHYELSPEVALNVETGVLETLDYDIVDRRPFSPWQWLADRRRRESAALVVFGPAWFPLRRKRSVCGFADVTSLYERPTGVPAAPWPTRLRRAFRRHLALREIARHDVVVVETEEIARRLVARVPGTPPAVVVAPNTASRLAVQGGPITRGPLALASSLTMLYTAAYYPHKNHEFLPLLAHELWNRHRIKARFLVTLQGPAWEERSDAFRAVCDNRGHVGVAELRWLHKQADAAIFPSLLEASSVTPLEALALGTPLFVSDRDFNRTVCGNAATYFDPLDPVAAAEVIAKALATPDVLAEQVAAGIRVAAAVPSPRERARQYGESVARDVTP
ncbi:glycosyltransferase [Nocardioides sp. HB32]